MIESVPFCAPDVAAADRGIQKARALFAAVRRPDSGSTAGEIVE